MQINIFLIPFIIILGLLMGQRDNRRSRLSYIIVCSVVLIFVAAMRSPAWMTNAYSIDTLNYKDYFESYSEMSWNDLWQSFYIRYFTGGEDFDIGYIALNKIIGLFTSEFYVFSLIADLLFFIPFGMILFRYCTRMQQLVFVFVFYISLIQIFLLGGGRQMFSIGFDLMALIAVVDRKKYLAILFFIIGTTIHFSSLLFLIPLLMVWYNISPRVLKFMHIICFIFFPLVLAMPNELIVFMGETSGMEKYADFGRGAIQGGATTFVILIEVISFICLITIKSKDIVVSRALQIFYVMAPLLTFFAPLIRSNGSMIRISLYYHLFLALLVPYAIDCAFKKRRESSVAYFVAIGVLAALSLSNGGIQYYFFWER